MRVLTCPTCGLTTTLPDDADGGGVDRRGYEIDPSQCEHRKRHGRLSAAVKAAKTTAEAATTDVAGDGDAKKETS